ncbi:MAG: Ig-like domain-containing protein [Deltaproteobacteria bacterium]|nr:Ig-like domain-containing protein [Deltaproteobacteria bacterium]
MNFSKPLAPDTPGASVQMRTAGGSAVLGSLELKGNKLIYRPSHPLAPDTDYVVTIAATLSDVLQRASGIQREVKFRTGAAEVSGRAADDRRDGPGREYAVRSSGPPSNRGDVYAVDGNEFDPPWRYVRSCAT